jgi:Flp pilus assembly protein TadD
LRHALGLVKRVLEKERNNAEAYLLKGKIQLKLEDSAGAIAPIEQSIKL